MVALKNIPSRIYLRAKIKVMSSYSGLNLRVQVVEKGTIESHVGSGGYIYLLMDVATAIYTKAGGSSEAFEKHPISQRSDPRYIFFKEARYATR